MSSTAPDFAESFQDNVLLSDQGVAQINDFGMSAILDTSGFTTKILRNVRFNAPELMPISEEASNVLPTFKSDIFSLGILFLQVFCIAFIGLSLLITYIFVALSRT